MAGRSTQAQGGGSLRDLEVRVPRSSSGNNLVALEGGALRVVQTMDGMPRSASGNSIASLSGNLRPMMGLGGTSPGSDWQDRGDQMVMQDPSEYVPANMPVQINLGKLRTLSSQSLTRLADEANDSGVADPALGSEGGGGQNPGWRVKNTFLDFDTPGSMAPGRLRPVFSDCRLADLGEAIDSDHLGSLPENTRFGRQETDASVMSDCSTVPPLMNQNSLAEASAAAAERRAQDTLLARSGASSGWATERFSDNLGAALKVKNTFIEFPEEQPATRLRNVLSAAGRLDQMGEE